MKSIWNASQKSIHIKEDVLSLLPRRFVKSVLHQSIPKVSKTCAFDAVAR